MEAKTERSKASCLRNKLSDKEAILQQQAGAIQGKGAEKEMERQRGKRCQ